MRNAFADEITKIGQNEKVVLLSGDIGNRMFDKYKDNYPDRFYNCGVAEANMIGMAAGLAMSGLRPVAYTINSFITARCYEQIRVDLCYHNVPVILAGVGGGLCYASLGATHHSLEDIASLRVLPNLAVLCPGDPLEVRACLQAALRHSGPVYIRLGKKGEPTVHSKQPVIQLGKVLPIQNGQDICFISTGNVLPLVMEAVQDLEKKGLSPSVVSCPSIKPLDEKFLEEAVKKYSHLVTIEEHSRLGGLGSAVAEWLSDHPEEKARLTRVGTDDAFVQEAGEQDHARNLLGLTRGRIVAAGLK